MSNPILDALTRRVRVMTAQDAPVPKAVLGTDADGHVGWRTGDPGNVWTLDDQAVPGWRVLPLLRSVTYQQPVQTLPDPTGLVAVTVGTLVNLTASVNSLQQQVNDLRAKLNDHIRATEALNAELRRVNLMRAS